MADGGEETILRNETPQPVTSAFSAGLQFVEQYGWFLLVAIIAVLFLKNRLQPKVNQWQQQREDAAYKKMDPDTAQSRLEAMERARQRMQEQLDQQAELYKQKQKEKEEKARQEKLEDWERHQQGRGYRSKIRTRDDEPGPSQPKPKPKKPLRDSDYNPLMGAGGGASFRPARRGFSGGG